MHEKRRRLRLFVTGMSLTLIGLSVPVLADDVSQLAARLATLRGDVEQLAQQLNAKSQDQKNALQSLARQSSDLELEVQREQMRVQRLNSVISKRRAEIKAEKAKGDRLVPVFEESIGKVRGYVEASMPFRKEERLAGLDKIAEQYKAGLLTPARALQRLWSFVEDEFRMTRESGLYKQTVTVDGRDTLAEVIRVGMVMLFYKTDDDQLGKLSRTDGAWVYESILDPEDQKQVMDLFTSFKKQIRVGYFELPYGLTQAATDAQPSLPELPKIARPTESASDGDAEPPAAEGSAEKTGAPQAPKTAKPKGTEQ